MATLLLPLVAWPTLMWESIFDTLMRMGGHNPVVAKAAAKAAEAAARQVIEAEYKKTLMQGAAIGAAGLFALRWINK
jgi:hypothetical protein